MRAGLVTLLAERGHAVVGESGRAEQMAALVAVGEPDVVVVDAGLPPSFTTEGLRAAAAVQERHPAVGVVVLTRSLAGSAGTGVVAPAAAGADGVLLPGRLDDADTLDAAVTHVAGGGLAVEPPLAAAPAPGSSPLEALTPRELDVLDLMARGLSNRGIAGELRLTTNTVATHVQHVFDKLGVPDSAAENRRVLAVLAYLNG